MLILLLLLSCCFCFVVSARTHIQMIYGSGVWDASACCPLPGIVGTSPSGLGLLPTYYGFVHFFGFDAKKCVTKHCKLRCLLAWGARLSPLCYWDSRFSARRCSEACFCRPSENIVSICWPLVCGNCRERAQLEPPWYGDQLFSPLGAYA